MTDKFDEALAEAERLSKLSDDSLVVELGRRVSDREREGGDARSQKFSGTFAADEREMGFDALKRVGVLWWGKLEPQLMQVICDPKNAELTEVTGNRSIPQVAAGLATAGMVSVLAPPAWVIILTTLVATRVVDSGLQAICEVWKGGTAVGSR